MSNAITEIDNTDLVFIFGYNPADSHPIVANHVINAKRNGAKIIVCDPRKIETARIADMHIALKNGSNIALLNAIGHVIIEEDLYDKSFVASRSEGFEEYRKIVEGYTPESVEEITGVSAQEIRACARMYASAKSAAILWGMGVTQFYQGVETVRSLTSLAILTGNLGKPNVGVNPLRGQNNVQGACDMGSFPHEFTGYRHVSDDAVRRSFEAAWGVTLDDEPGLRIPNMLDSAVEGSFKGIYVQGEDIAQSDPNTQHVTAGLAAMECVVVQDIFMNETANYAHVFLPGSSFLEKDGTFTNAERRIALVNKAMAPLGGYADWEVTMMLSNALGYRMDYKHPSEIMDEIARMTPTFKGVSYDRIRELGSIQWPCNDAAPEGTPIMHEKGFVRGKGKFMITAYVPTDERTGPRFPLLLTTGRILSQYNVGAQTRRTENVAWHPEDVLEIHPFDAESRGIRDGDNVSIASRVGETTLKAMISDRMQPGVVYTTFHHVGTGANVVTTDFSDWATNCPEYKVTAVEVRLSNQQSEWQRQYSELRDATRRIASPAAE